MDMKLHQYECLDTENVSAADHPQKPFPLWFLALALAGKIMILIFKKTKKLLKYLLECLCLETLTSMELNCFKVEPSRHFTSCTEANNCL